VVVSRIGEDENWGAIAMIGMATIACSYSIEVEV